MRHTKSGRTIIVVALAVFLSPLGAHADTPSSPTMTHEGISTTGECLAKVVHDRGAITITSTAKASTSSQASAIVLKSHAQLKEEVKDLKLRDFYAESVEYSVHQNCAYNKGKRACDGFNARVGTRFETSEIDRLGDVIRISSDLAADESSRLETFASPKTLQTARENCLEQAMRNATEKATRIARGAGVRLGNLLQARENIYPLTASPAPLARQGMMALEASAADSSGLPMVEAKPLEMKITVTSLYAINR